MKIKTLAKAAGNAPESYNISGGVINGIDFSDFVEGSVFVGNDDTRGAGIFGADWINGVLHVTLGQQTTPYQFDVRSHDWTNVGWIDAADYDPKGRYVQATNPHTVALLESGKAEYWRDDHTGAWTVRLTQPDLDMEPTQ